MDSRWRLPVAAHLGIRDPAHPQFEHLAGSTDVVAQVEFAAEQGFAGVSDNELLRRPPAERRRLADALQRTGLRLTGFTVHDLDRLDDALAAADLVQPSYLTVLGLQGRPDTAIAEAAARVGAAGHVLGLEPVARERVPDVRIERMAQALAVVATIGDSALRIVADTCHQALVGDDPAEQLLTAGPLLCAVQFADIPGRIEPGAGRLDFAGIVTAVQQSGFSGPVDAECFASLPGASGERAVLAALDAVLGAQPQERSVR
jgi:hydroxypyruvate isomerase